MMAGELEKSQFANDTLRQSTEKLAQLDETYSTLDSLLSNSKNLLGTLLRSQKSDTWYLETAFWVLVCTIGWLVFRRLFYGPLWWLVYAPLKLAFYTLFGVFGMVGSKSSSAVGSSLSMASEPASYSTVSVGNEDIRLNNRDAPVIDVGPGNGNVDQRPINTEEETMTEKVEQIIDDDQNYHTPGDEEQGLGGEVAWDETLQDTQPEFDVIAQSEGQESESEKNPMKRMWDEPEEVAKEAQRVRDEL